jgi:hypothetical protein
LLPDQLDEWQHFYNWGRALGALGGRTPIDRVCELLVPGVEGEDLEEDDPAEDEEGS